MQVGLQLAIASAQAVDGVEDALVNLAVPFKVVDDATFEVVGAFSSLGAAKNYADERRSDMGKQWSKREAQILAVVDLRWEWWATCKAPARLCPNSEPRHAVA